MSFLSRTLQPDETILVSCRPHWRSLVRPVLITWLAAGLAGVAGGFIEVQVYDPASRSAAWIMVAVAYLMVLILFVLRPVSRWARTQLVVTDERVLYRSARDPRRPLVLPLARISAVRFRHTLTERMLGTGSLILECGHLPPVEVDDVPHVARVHEHIYDELHRLPPVPLQPPDEPGHRGVRLWFS